MNLVIAVPAVDCAGAVAAGDIVVAIPAIGRAGAVAEKDLVVAGVAEQLILSGAAIETIVAVAAPDLVIAVAAEQRVVAVVAPQPIVTFVTLQPVATVAAEQHVVAGAAVEAVIAAIAAQVIVADVSEQHVVATAAVDAVLGDALTGDPFAVIRAGIGQGHQMMIGAEYPNLIICPSNASAGTRCSAFDRSVAARTESRFGRQIDSVIRRHQFDDRMAVASHRDRIEARSISTEIRLVLCRAAAGAGGSFRNLHLAELGGEGVIDQQPAGEESPRPEFPSEPRSPARFP